MNISHSKVVAKRSSKTRWQYKKSVGQLVKMTAGFIAGVTALIVAITEFIKLLQALGWI